MKNKSAKIAAAGVILVAVIYVIVFHAVREHSVENAVPVMNTVYAGDAYIIAGENTRTSSTTAATAGVSADVAHTETAYDINAETVYRTNTENVYEMNTESTYDKNAETADDPNSETVYETNTRSAYGANTETAYAIPGMINLNTATKEELMSINGIGEVIAGRIIEYRELHPFGDIAELLDIKGIGEKVYAKIKPSITV